MNMDKKDELLLQTFCDERGLNDVTKKAIPLPLVYIADTIKCRSMNFWMKPNRKKETM